MKLLTFILLFAMYPAVGAVRMWIMYPTAAKPRCTGRERRRYFVPRTDLKLERLKAKRVGWG